MGRRENFGGLAAAWAFATVLSVFSQPALAKSPIAVATIRPIDALVAAVMDGVGSPTTLIPPDQSPKFFMLHDRDERALRQVDLIFWVSPYLETSLAQTFADPEVGAEIVQLADTPGLLMFPPRRGGEWGQPPASQRPSGEGDRPAAADGHVWLDADNAKLMVGRIASALTDVDFPHAEVYRMNAAELRKRIAAMDRDVAEILAPVRGRPFLVLHDDFQYLEARYGLQAAGSIAVDADALSPERLKEVAAKIARLHVNCVIGDSPDDSDQLRAIADAAQVRAISIDIYGSDVKEGPDLYFKTMKEIATGFATCLSEP